MDPVFWGDSSGVGVEGSIPGPNCGQVGASVGGSGGLGNSAGTVNVTNYGNITTGATLFVRPEGFGGFWRETRRAGRDWNSSVAIYLQTFSAGFGRLIGGG
jgi:hypothetical protein